MYAGLPPPSYDDAIGAPPPSYEAAVKTRPQVPTVGGGDTTSAVSFVLNGETVSLDATQIPINMTLNDYIRYKTRFTGTKVTCHEGGCGACAVVATFPNLTTGKSSTRAINSCLRPVLACNGMTITTTDGLNQGGTVLEISKHLANQNGSQCGYCSSGFVASVYALLNGEEASKGFSKLEIEQALDGNLCRCTGYKPILRAMHKFATASSEADHHDDDDEPSCLKVGCQRRGTHVDVEEVSKLLDDHHKKDKRPSIEATEHPLAKAATRAMHPRVVAQQRPPRKIAAVGGDGTVWQDCNTLDDLEFYLPWYAGANNRVMLVVAQTSLGVTHTSLRLPNALPDVYLHVGRIPELSTVSQDPTTGLSVGPNVRIHDLIHYLRTAVGPQSYSTKGFDVAADHLLRVANRLVRNVGSIGGNLMLAHALQSPGACLASDGVIAMFGLDAKVEIYDCNAATLKQLGIAEFFASEIVTASRYIRRIIVPWAASANVRLQTYKVATRSVNAHALINAAMRITIDPTSGLMSDAHIIVGGLGPQTQRITNIETFLNGNTLNSATLNTLMTSIGPQNLQATIEPSKKAYLQSVALSYLYKFMVHIFPGTVPPAIASAADRWLQRDAPVTGVSTYQTDPAEYPVSMPMPKVEAIQQTTGKAVYTDDIPEPMDCVHVCTILAPQGNGAFTVDATAASALPGFIRLFTASDFATQTQNAWQNGPLLANGTVFFAGQVVAAVAARSRREAQNIAHAVVVTVTQTTPNVISMAGAIAAKSFYPVPLQAVTKGDAVAAFNSAPKQMTGTVQIGYQYHFHMEDHAALVIPQEDVLEVHCATQMPVGIQQEIAAVCGMPSSKVVVTTKRCGGGFGGKITSSMLPAGIAAFIATTLGRPTKVIMGLHDTMNALGCRSGRYLDYQIGTTADGRILALNATVYAPCGAFPQDETGATAVSMHSLDNAYFIPNVTINGQLLQTNIPATSPVRGPGWVQAVGLMESVISTVASQLSMDPHVVREKNFFKVGQTTADGMLLRWWNMPEIWAQLKADAGYDQRRANVTTFNTNNRWIKRGLAMTPVRFGIGISGANYDSIVNLYPDGTIGVSHGGSEIGQGINTKVMQVVAMKFGLPDLTGITCNATTTRCISGASNVTGGSITSELCCLSIMHACDELNRRLAPFRPPGTAFAAAVANAGGAGVELSAVGWSYTPAAPSSGIFNYNSTSAAVTEVEVDVLTGQFLVRQVDILFDCGRSMNPIIDMGQVEGGFIFGMGYYTQEFLAWDEATGTAQHANTWRYKPPATADCPIVFNTNLMKNAPNPYGVLSSKACGEPGVALASSVVAAIEDAITAALQAANPSASRFVCAKLPLLVTDIQTACQVTPAQLTI